MDGQPVHRLIVIYMEAVIYAGGCRFAYVVIVDPCAHVPPRADATGWYAKWSRLMCVVFIFSNGVSNQLVEGRAKALWMCMVEWVRRGGGWIA